MFHLTLPVPIPDKEKKLSWIFIFTLSGASKGFTKAFIKPFETRPQKVWKLKFDLIFILIQLAEMHGTLKLVFAIFYQILFFTKW